MVRRTHITTSEETSARASALLPWLEREGSLDLDEVLSRPLFPNLATSDNAVSRVSPVWFLWEERAIRIVGNTAHDTFPARVAREPRCALSLVDFDAATGRVHHVGMRGVASVVPFDRERAIRKLQRYLGDDVSRWPAGNFALRAATLVLIRFAPETVVLRDQSYTLR